MNDALRPQNTLNTVQCTKYNMQIDRMCGDLQLTSQSYNILLNCFGLFWQNIDFFKDQMTKPFFDLLISSYYAVFSLSDYLPYPISISDL